MSTDLGKVKKVLSDTFVKDNEDVTEDRAMELVVKAEIAIKELEEEKENDDSLNAAKSVVKDLSAGYGSAIKYEKAKIKYLIAKIQEIQEGVNEAASV